MPITLLQKKRMAQNWTIRQLAFRAHLKSPDYDEEYLELVIECIESNICQCPKPRKTYEWKALAKALECEVADIYE
ncbi:MULTISPECIES: hypothetical protein [Listeria]|uniref:hypothetical protein n=1 Tax=Listeria TaxID=1637 RepID=UPI000B58CE5C|nr:MULTISPECIES: hypothetical protein [Listeria]